MGKKFIIDARLILQLGRDSIKDHTTALIELVKNSFDADASKVEIDIFSKGSNKYIRVADNGFGMTSQEIEKNWLRIGYSEKKFKKNSKTGRRKTGEKGIGRIASDRLGSNLMMLSKSEEDVLQGIEINWDDFDVSDKSIGDIPIKEVANPSIKIPHREGEDERYTGTEMIISNLRTEWTENDIQNLYQELSYFSPLFSDEFEIRIENDINPKFSKPVESSIYDTAEISLEVVYDGIDTLVYEFKNKLIPDKNKTETILLEQLIQQDTYSPLACGPVTMKFYFFVRKNDLLYGTSFSLTDLKDFLVENYGVKLYRDNVVVKPYGFSNNQFGQDWLGLDVEKSKDPAGLGRDTYRVNANNIVGYVNFTRDHNPNLIDSASREGLVENTAFYSLKDLINSSIKLLASYRVDINKEISKDKKIVNKNKSVNQNLSTLRNKFSDVINEISLIKSIIDKNKDIQTTDFSKTLNSIEEAITETEKTFEDLLEEKRVLSALATLGISSAVFGHETESAITTFKVAATNAKDYLIKSKPDVETAVEELTEAITQARLVSSWGIFALSRIEKDKRTKRNRRVKEIITRTIEHVKPALEALSITIDLQLDKVTASTYAMDIESILVNLLTNSFSAVPNSIRQRKIRISLKNEDRNEIKGMLLTVADSGPGIAPEFHDKVWKPLFTTKTGTKERQSGTGLGLTIIKSIVTELEGDIILSTDPELLGAKFDIWLPKN